MVFSLLQPTPPTLHPSVLPQPLFWLDDWWWWWWWYTATPKLDNSAMYYSHPQPFHLGVLVEMQIIVLSFTILYGTCPFCQRSNCNKYWMPYLQHWGSGMSKLKGLLNYLVVLSQPWHSVCNHDNIDTHLVKTRQLTPTWPIYWTIVHPWTEHWFELSGPLILTDLGKNNTMQISKKNCAKCDW